MRNNSDFNIKAAVSKVNKIQSNLLMPMEKPKLFRTLSRVPSAINLSDSKRELTSRIVFSSSQKLISEKINKK